jgi:hypothetical protein
MAPPDVPEGVSPDCQDVVFAPGEVASRPGFKRQLSPLGSSITSAKSFVNPDPTSAHGTLQNLYLDAGGNLWVENVIASPGTLTLITAGLATNSYMKAVTAFGREYLAISDGLHGTDVPLQWDGTNLDRVTQDGPGEAPAIINVIIPATTLAAGAGFVLTITSASIGPFFGGPPGTYLGIAFNVTAGANQLALGTQVTVAGSSDAFFNGTWFVTDVINDTQFFVGAYSTTTHTGVGGTATVAAGGTLTRGNNIVTGVTATAHGLAVGYQVQITGVPALIVGAGVVSIVIKNADNPGLATVTTNSAHNLVPGTVVTVDQVNAPVVTTSTALVRAGGIVKATTAAAHGLSIGSSITINGAADATFNGTFIVIATPTTTTLSWAQVDVDAISTTSFILLNWPLPTISTFSNFEVVAAPTPTTFQIAINYSDGTWTSGVVSFGWDGIFFVSAIVSPTIFRYQQIGPPGASAVAGTVTPRGQAAPGEHQMQVLFLTRNGAITSPSPPVKFVANGGQYLAVGNIPRGPSNVVARILAFTGAQGALFFYIPVPAQINGQMVSTATQISDNVTNYALLDFSDNTLFASLGISIPGNTLANQITLDGALGFGFYASRLFTWGQRNRVLNFLNMGFDGGFFPSDPTVPTGWFVEPVSGLAGGTLVAGHFGQAWQFGGAGNIHQGAYLDGYGAPILQPNTQYRLRAWVKGLGSTATVTIQAFATPFTAIATLTGVSATGSFVEAAFSLKTPATIIPDTVLVLTGVGGVVDELSIIYAENPYSETIFHASYADNPEGFDSVSGVLGSTDDTQKLMGLAEIRDTAFALTQDPGGRLHEFSDNGVTEPSGWTFRQIATNCGLISTFALCWSQSDSGTASGGEQWFAWASCNGAQIFGGGEVFKISQEIQPDWVGAKDAGASQWSKATGLNPAALTTAWALNDPKARVIYFGLPVLGLPV